MSDRQFPFRPLAGAIAATLLSAGVSAGVVQAQSIPAPAPASSAVAPLSITPTHPLNLSIQDSAAQAGNLNRAKNLARQVAEKANGGLSRYQADRLMHGFAAEAPFTDNGNGTYTFTFLGGKPGYKTATVQSVVTINTTDWTTHLDYNGAIRQSTTAPSTAPSMAVPSTTAPLMTAP